MTTSQRDPSLYGALRMLIRLAVWCWLGWIALVLYVTAWMYVPAVALAVTVVAILGLYWYVRSLIKWCRMQRARVEEQRATNAALRAEFYRQERVKRAEKYPELVWEEHADEWSKEMHPNE